MYTLVIKPLAIDAAADAYNWYEQQSEGLGDAFVRELDKCFDKLEQTPLSYSKVHQHFRQLIMDKFPYVLVFEIIKKEVVVYAVFHTSRNPKEKYQK